MRGRSASARAVADASTPVGTARTGSKSGEAIRCTSTRAANNARRQVAPCRLGRSAHNSFAITAAPPTLGTSNSRSPGTDAATAQVDSSMPIIQKRASRSARSRTWATAAKLTAHRTESATSTACASGGPQNHASLNGRPNCAETKSGRCTTSAWA